MTCGRIFSVAKCVCVLPAGHSGQHQRAAAERKSAQVNRYARFYYSNQQKCIEYQRQRRRTVKRTTYQIVLRTIQSVERNWRLRLAGKIRDERGRIKDKPLDRSKGSGEFERVRVELRRCADRLARAPATTFLRLPRIAP